MTIQAWLKEATQKLTVTDISTSRLDCLVLLEDMLGKDRTQLLAHDDQELTGEQKTSLDGLVKRRAQHEPLAYIRGKTEFYGREFLVTPDTLEPRPETETMFGILNRSLLSEHQITGLVDVGTGSGAIAITAKLEFPHLNVFATEIIDAALKIAKMNAIKHGAKVSFYQGDLLKPLEKKLQERYVILANLPYVPDNHTINQAAMQEPKVAIFGGADGLDLYRRMFEQIDVLSSKPLFILTESLPFQHHALATTARHYGYTLEETNDFIQLFVS